MLENELTNLMRTTDKLRANANHPIIYKFEQVIKLLDNLNLELEWHNSRLSVKDTCLNVVYDLLDIDDNPINELPLPDVYKYKLVRDAIPVKGCMCRFCEKGKTNDQK